MGWGQSRCAAGKAGRHGGHPSRWFSTCAAATPRLRRVFWRDDLRVVPDFGVGSGGELSTPRAGVGRHNRGTGQCRGSTSQMARRVQRAVCGQGNSRPSTLPFARGGKKLHQARSPAFLFQKVSPRQLAAKPLQTSLRGRKGHSGPGCKLPCGGDYAGFFDGLNLHPFKPSEPGF
jgi:hypothetical protein